MENAVSLAEAKERLEDLVAQAAAGETVRIEVPGQGAVTLTKAEPLQTTPFSRKLLLGQWKGIVHIPAKQLFEPLSEEELAWLSGETSL
jgi:hypothetical protein